MNENSFYKFICPNDFFMKGSYLDKEPNRSQPIDNTGF